MQPWKPLAISFMLMTPAGLWAFVPPNHNAPVNHAAPPAHAAQPVHQAPVNHVAQQPVHQAPVNHVAQQPVHQAPVNHVAQQPVHQAPVNHAAPATHTQPANNAQPHGGTPSFGGFHPPSGGNPGAAAQHINQPNRGGQGSFVPKVGGGQPNFGSQPNRGNQSPPNAQLGGRPNLGSPGGQGPGSRNPGSPVGSGNRSPFANAPQGLGQPGNHLPSPGGIGSSLPNPSQGRGAIGGPGNVGLTRSNPFGANVPLSGRLPAVNPFGTGLNGARIGAGVGGIGGLANGPGLLAPNNPFVANNSSNYGPGGSGSNYSGGNNYNSGSNSYSNGYGGGYGGNGYGGGYGGNGYGGGYGGNGYGYGGGGYGGNGYGYDGGYGGNGYGYGGYGYRSYAPYSWDNGFGYWNNNWYPDSPFLASAGWSWLLPSISSFAYSNPYYFAPSTTEIVTALDYSVPIPVPTDDPVATAVPVAPSPDSGTDAPQDPTQREAYIAFEAAKAEFLKNHPDVAQNLIERAIKLVPGDANLHQFRAMTLFAQGQYGDAAAVLYGVLAAGPGWDWASMIGFYPDTDTYTRQLRQLEAYVRTKPQDGAGHFLLAYEYLVTGSKDAAIRQFKDTVRFVPNDKLSKRLLQVLSGAQAPADTAQPPVAEIR